MKKSAFAAAVALLVAALPAAASVHIYTSQASFLAALTTAQTADYNSLGNGFYGGKNYGQGQVSYNGVTVTSSTDYIFSSNSNVYGTGTFLQVQQGTPTYATFSSSQIGNAFGFNVEGARPVSLTVGSDTLTFPVNMYPNFSYLGVVSDQSFSTVGLYTDGGGVDLDNLTFGTAAASAPATRDYSGGTPADPVPLSGDQVTDASGHISGGYSEQSYVSFDWAGGDFSALGSLSGADPMATFDFDLFDADASSPLATITLGSANDFSGFLSQTLAVGRYSIGFTTTSTLDPDWAIRFTTPVAGTAVTGVPEPLSWMMLIAGTGFIGAMVRRQRQALSPARPYPA